MAAIVVVFLLICGLFMPDARHSSGDHGFIYATICSLPTTKPRRMNLFSLGLCQRHEIGVNKSESI